MNTRFKTMFILVLALALLVFGSVTAQELTTTEFEEIEECLNDEISGVVVGIDFLDGNAVVTISYKDGEDHNLCKVTIEGITHDHPIVNLLGIYFGISLNDLKEALDTSRVCLSEIENEWYLVDCDEDEFDLEGNVISYQDGTLIVLVNGELLEFDIEENDVDEQLLEAIETLTVEWELVDGKVTQLIEKIAEYHQQGIGFGVLVKLLAIAEANDDVTLEELIEEFLGGTGIGELFKDYGKPSLLGVGHVRQEIKEKDTNEDFPGMKRGKKFNQSQGEKEVVTPLSGQEEDQPANPSENRPANKPEKADRAGFDNKMSKENKADNKDKSVHGICNARASGGLAKANNKDISCP
jgi:hypothetical protein